MSKGGRFEGEGSYACTFSPAPKCKRQTKQEQVNDEIAKIFYRDSSINEEWEYAKRMIDVDPEQKYLIYPISRCEVLRKEILKDPTAFQCSFLRRKKNKVFQMLKMSHGGVPLDVFMESNDGQPANIMIDIIKSILQGIKLLNKNQLVHNDLKFNNVVINPITHKTKIIDFGLVISFTDAFSEVGNRFIESNYWLHPPEYRIIPYIKGHPLSKEEARRLFKHERKLLDIYFSERLPISLIDIIHEDVIPYCEHEHEYIKWVMKLTRKQNADKFMEKYACKVDLYSLGVSLVHLMNYVTYANSVQKTKFMNIIRELIHPDPLRRPSIAKLTKMIDSARA